MISAILCLEMGLPVSFSERMMQASEPSMEQATSTRPSRDQLKSSTDWSNASLRTKKGRFRRVDHTEKLLKKNRGKNWDEGLEQRVLMGKLATNNISDH